MSIESYLKEFEIKRVGKATLSAKDERIKHDIVERIKMKISSDPNIDIMDYENAKFKVHQNALKWIEEETRATYGTNAVSLEDKYAIYDALIQNMFGFGAIEPILRDDDITEIMINGAKEIFVERDGHIEQPKDSYGKQITFSDETELKTMIDKIVAPLNRKIDESNPIVDARLPDGSRVNVVLSPISLGGTTVTIRRFPKNPFTMANLIRMGALSENCALFLKELVEAKYNILVSGGTGSGKTTFLNALSMFIPKTERVITIEDSAELKFSQVKNLIRMECRNANIEGKGEIDIRSLVRTSLRMRPDRIVVGEIRGGEALDMLQAMNTGHDGSLTTGHANSAADMLLRLETMVLMSGMDLPLSSIKRQIASAVDIIVHLGRLRDGTRRVVEICEITGYENDEIIMNTIYKFKESGFDSENNRIIGELEQKVESLTSIDKLLSAGKNVSSIFHKEGINEKNA